MADFSATSGADARQALIDYLKEADRPSTPPAKESLDSRPTAYEPGGQIVAHTVCQMGCHGADYTDHRYETLAERQQLEKINTVAQSMFLATALVKPVTIGAQLLGGAISRLPSASAPALALAGGGVRAMPSAAQAGLAVAAPAAAIATVNTLKDQKGNGTILENRAANVPAETTPGPVGATNAGPSSGLSSKALNVARRAGINAQSPTSQQLLQSLDMRVSDFIVKNRAASIKSVFPSEFMNGTVKEALLSGNSTVRKLLLDGRFVK